MRRLSYSNFFLLQNSSKADYWQNYEFPPSIFRFTEINFQQLKRLRLWQFCIVLQLYVSTFSTQTFSATKLKAFLQCQPNHAESVPFIYAFLVFSLRSILSPCHKTSKTKFVHKMYIRQILSAECLFK